MTVFLRQIDTVLIDANGVRTPAASKTIIRYNETAAAALSSATSDANGVIAEGSITADVNDVIRYSHATHPEVIRIRAKATQAEAYIDPEYNAVTYVMQNDATLRSSEIVDLYAYDTDNSVAAPLLIGSGVRGETIEIPTQTTIERNWDIVPVSRSKNRTGKREKESPLAQSVVITPTGGSDVTLATTTELLTGTNALKVITPDVLASLWEQGSNIASASTISVGEGGYFTITGTSTITDIDFAVDKAGRRAWLKFDGILALTNGVNLILPTGANITTAAGDTAEFISEGSDVVRCVSYQRASGYALVDSAGTAATTTEVLTGTELVKYVTPDSLAALWEQGPDIASASTISIGDGGQFNVTGTSTITDIDFAVDKTGREVTLKFAAALVITNGANLICLSGSNITTAAGDMAIFKSEGSDVVRMVHYIRANNFPRTHKEVYLEEYGHTNAGLAAAISAIGATVTKLVVTENLAVSSSQTIPSTCLLDIQNGAIITVSGSSTLTIGKFTNPGNVRCFSGVDATNQVVFAAGAVENDTYNIAWYMGLASAADASYAVIDIFSSITTNGGGCMFVPIGDWKVHNITCPTNYTRIIGMGQGSDTGGSRFIPKDSSTSYLFQVRNNFRNISLEYCALSVGTNTTTNAFSVDVDTGSSGFGIHFNNVTIHGLGASSIPQVRTVTDNGAAEIVQMSLHKCKFIQPNNTQGLYVDSINIQCTVQDTSCSVGTGDAGIGLDLFRCGWAKVINCDFRGINAAYDTPSTSIGTVTCTISTSSTTLTATSGSFTEAMIGQRVFRSGSLDSYIIGLTSPTVAILNVGASSGFTAQVVTVYKWADSASRAGTCVRFGDVAAASIDGMQEEGFNHALWILGGSGVKRTVELKDAQLNDRVRLEGNSVSLSIINGTRPSLFLSDTAGVDAQIFSTGTQTTGIAFDYAIALQKAQNFGADHAGGSVFRMDIGHRDGYMQMDMGFWLRLLEKSGSDTSRPLMDILTTYAANSVPGQKLLRLGVASANTSGNPFLYGWDCERDSDTGYLKWRGRQVAPYNAWTFDHPIGYDELAAGTVTQITSRTTAVTCNFIHGIITLYSTGSLGPGGSSIFQLNNTWIQQGDQVRTQIVGGSTTELVTADIVAIGGNFAKILVFNHSATTADTGTLKLKFMVWKGGGIDGVSY